MKENIVANHVPPFTERQIMTLGDDLKRSGYDYVARLRILTAVNAYDANQKTIVALLEALQSIADSGGNTLLGRCCVENRCVPSDDGATCELQEKVNAAFRQMASVAKEAIAQAEGKL